MAVQNNSGIVKEGRIFTFMMPPLFLLYFSNAMTVIITTDMIVYRTCQSLLTINKNSCNLLHSNSSSDEAVEIEKIVQPEASYIILCDSLIHSIVSASLILFLGPWSDKYGRKPLLIIGYLAPTLRNIILAILNNWDINPWIFMTASISSALTGGGAGVMMASICFINDITSNERRTWHLACLDGAVMVGGLIGRIVGPLIFQQFGYITLFFVASVLSIVALLHITLYVPETVKKATNIKWGNPFNVHLIKHIFESSSKKRPGLNRWILWNCILILSLRSIFESGEDKILYLFTNTRVGWNPIDFSYFMVFSSIVTGAGSMMGLKLTKKYLGLRDVTQAFIGCVSDFLTMLITALTLKPWHLYLSSCASVFAGMITPTVRSILSTSAPPEDIGKIFSLATFMVTIVSLIGVPLFTVVYTNYLPPIYPSPVYLLAAAIFFIMMLPLSFINWKLKKSSLTIQMSVEES